MAATDQHSNCIDMVDRNQDKSVSPELSHQKEYIIYSRRWLIVIIVCIINITSGMIWICFSPITNYTTFYYKISTTEVNWLSLTFPIVAVPFGFVAAWLLDTVGLRASIIFAAWLNLIGSLLRNLTTLDLMPTNSRYSVLLTGQFLAACAQPFILFVPTKLAAIWFPDSQRAVANTLASMANPIGILAANIIAPVLVTSPEKLPRLLWVCTGVAILGVITSSLGVCSSAPPTPPSASAEEGTKPFFWGLKELLKVKSYWVLFVVFGAGLATFTALASFLAQILCPRGYSNGFSGLCGALMIVGGFLGAITTGIIVDRTKRFEEVAVACYVFALLGGIAFTEVSRFRDQQIIIAVSLVLFGFFGFGSYPVSLELAVEITYPVAEATSSGLLFISGQIQSLVYMMVAQLIRQPLPATERSLPNNCGAGEHLFDWTVPNLFLNGVMTFFAILLMLFFRPVYRRLIAEKISPVESNINVITISTSL